MIKNIKLKQSVIKTCCDLKGDGDSYGVGFTVLELFECKSTWLRGLDDCWFMQSGAR